MKTDTKDNIQNFWGELYKQAYHDSHSELDPETLIKMNKELEVLFKHRQHLAVTEMDLNNINGKTVLEVGSGAGAHSTLFRGHGAIMHALDITYPRARSTLKKMGMINSKYPCHAVQSDAENLPYPDNYFDIVYSNGVIHHTPDTEKALEEIWRVLKPGGEAVIMLYAKNSFLYWVNLFFIKGVLLGNIFRHKNWLGRTTEWMSDKKQTVYNPETKVYTGNDIKRMFQNFSSISIRKNSFQIQQLPVLGKLVSSLIGRFTGYNKSGVLIYGYPWRNESGIESKLGEYIGFGLNILAKK